MAKQRFLKKHRSPPKIKRVTVYDNQAAAERERDKRAKVSFGIDVVVQHVPGGFIVRDLQLAETIEANKASLPKPTLPAPRSYEERVELRDAMQAVEMMALVEAETVYDGRSKEPKSIYAEVPVRSIARPKAKSKRQEHEETAHYRIGRYAPAEIARGWRRLPRTE